MLVNQPQPMVFIVDDDKGVRSSISILLKTVGIASSAVGSANEFLGSYDPKQPGCLVLDIRMPGMSGLDLQEHLNRLGATIPVIFMTGFGDVPMAVEAMQRGAFDFLQKPFRDQELIDRVQLALRRDQENRALIETLGHCRERLSALTKRERDVLALMTQGKQNKVMALDLGLSQRTIEIHRAHVMEKMGVQSVAQLVRMVIDAQTDA